MIYENMNVASRATHVYYIVQSVRPRSSLSNGTVLVVSVPQLATYSEKFLRGSPAFIPVESQCGREVVCLTVRYRSSSWCATVSYVQ